MGAQQRSPLCDLRRKGRRESRGCAEHLSLSLLGRRAEGTERELKLSARTSPVCREGLLCPGSESSLKSSVG